MVSGAVSKAMPMDSEYTLYHVMSLLRLRLAMTGRNAVGATLPCLGTAFETATYTQPFSSLIFSLPSL